MLNQVKLAQMFAVVGALASLVSYHAIAKPGFFSIADEQIPEGARMAAQSVLKGFVFHGKAQLKLKPKKYDAGIRALETSFAASSDPLMRENLKVQIELIRRCKRLKLKSCESGFESLDSGTFFVIDEGGVKKLVTARHVIEDATNGTELEQLCEMRKPGIRLRLVLMNARGEVALDSVNGPERTVVRVAGNGSLVGSAPEVPALQGMGPDAAATSDDAMNDFAIVESNRPIALPALTWAPDELVNRGSFFALGFPSTTSNREANADGNSLYSTIGVEVPLAPPVSDAAGQPIAYDPAIGAAFVKAHSDNVLILDTDLNHGMSGGPVVDADGKVHGDAVIGFKQDVAIDLDASVPQSVWAVRPFAINGVRETLVPFLEAACE